MLTFKNLNVFFILLLLVTIGCDIKFGVSWMMYVGIAFAYSLLLFYGCYYVGSNMFIRIVCSVKTDNKIVALSFDDGPDEEKTPAILQILNNEKIPATFFCIGNRIAGNEAILKQIDDDEHLIGNHTFTHHYWFDMFGAKKMQEDMQLMDLETKKAIDKTPRFFRPPYGVTNPNLKKAVANGNYIPVGWSIRSMDTVIKNEQKLLKKVKKELKPGAIFLFHDTSAATVAILPAFISYVKANGYQVVRLDKMLNLQAYV